jgi:hypothetical protein
MTQIKQDVNLIDYVHNKKADYKTTVDELFILINDYTNQNELKGLYNYFEKTYDLPEIVVKQSIRQYIAKSYLFKSGKFDFKLTIKNIPKSILNYTALIYALFFVNFKTKVKDFKLIIDAVTSSREMRRWEKLLNLFGADKVLCITRGVNLKKKFPKYNMYNKKSFRGINILDLLKSIFNEFFFGIWVILRISLKTRVNLLPISIKIIHEYLIFKSLFKLNKSEYIIQEKHYSTEPIKNYLFKKLGGTASTSIQKNIIQLSPIFFYLDLDILFSLGKKGCSRLYEYGGRIDNIEPIGSLFMEHYWFDNQNECKKKFDIAILGINTSNAYERLDAYDKFMDDNYSLYQWVARLSKENPEYKIVLIHHASVGEDKIENDILSSSNVKILDKNHNSYEIAFSSKMAITYGSTMGYELNAHNLPTFFIDPGNRCSFLPEKGIRYIDSMRINSYESLSLIAKEIINKNKLLVNKEKNSLNNLCLDSSDVSYKIYRYLMKRNSKVDD